ncbi:MAG: phospho-N-acetylmuramoyl-pentapeptide-transferase [Christensenellaceae bacterium]|jgi:phospho-N-acetylmuramoyl-pentapeptide-transferase
MGEEGIFIVAVSLLCMIVTFAVTFVASKVLIPVLKRVKAGQHVRDDGPQTHLKKEGTPTMGGISILVGLAIVTLVFASIRGVMQEALFLVISTTAFALIGFLDDFLKLFRKRSLGLRAWQKIVLQFAVSGVIACYAYFAMGIHEVVIPGARTVWDLGAGFIPFTMFVLIAMVNSLNLTDGLDGLATILTTENAIAFFIILVFAIFPAGAAGANALGGEGVLLFDTALMGACAAFLCFNVHPAKVFMGDTGSFALGAAITVIAITMRQQLLLPIMGFMFVLSAVSVIIQVGSYKTRGKRVFRMAPLHHHFELGGMKETRVVLMYAVITGLLCVLTLALSL